MWEPEAFWIFHITKFQNFILLYVLNAAFNSDSVSIISTNQIINRKNITKSSQIL